MTSQTREPFRGKRDEQRPSGASRRSDAGYLNATIETDLKTLWAHY